MMCGVVVVAIAFSLLKGSVTGAEDGQEVGGRDSDWGKVCAASEQDVALLGTLQEGLLAGFQAVPEARAFGL